MGLGFEFTGDVDLVEGDCVRVDAGLPRWSRGRVVGDSLIGAPPARAARSACERRLRFPRTNRLSHCISRGEPLGGESSSMIQSPAIRASS